jgi:hypothetical protein
VIALTIKDIMSSVVLEYILFLLFAFVSSSHPPPPPYFISTAFTHELDPGCHVIPS